MSTVITDLGDEFDTLLNNGPIDEAHLRQELERCSQLLGAIILELLNRDDLIDQVVASSYLHSNGFTKLVLIDRGVRLSLHVWNQTGGELAGNLHNHRWPFASMVLCGSISMEHYSDRMLGDALADVIEFDEFSYTSPGPDSVYQLEAVGLQLLRREFFTTVSAGQMFGLDCNVIHLAWGSDRNTVTLVLQGPPVRRRTRVFSRVGHEVARIEARRLTPSEAIKCLTKLAGTTETDRLTGGAFE